MLGLIAISAWPLPVAWKTRNRTLKTTGRSVWRAVKTEADGLRAEREAMREKLDRCNARIAELTEEAHTLTDWRSEERAALERAQSRADAAEAEIIRLKAKLYDFMTAAKD